MVADNRDPWRYDGQRVVVTGCSSGIGAATAQEAADLGAEVIAIDLVEPSTAVAAFVRCDLGDPASIAEAVSALEPPVHALFNCAGISGAAPASDVMRVNFLGLRAFTEQVVPLMSEGGAVASVASLGGLGWEAQLPTIRELLAIDGFEPALRWCEDHPALFERGGYGLSKQAVIAYTKLRAVVFARAGVRINCTGPSVTLTPMLARSAAVVGQEYLDNFPHPSGRPAQPVEQARVLVFLNSGAASFVSGQNLWVDAGYTAGLLSGDIVPPR
jgi:NAD(P)-dependent dehydrogenase (short-subunit alcohol dehydrogenase family)